jgi:hypothetical protein
MPQSARLLGQPHRGTLVEPRDTLPKIHRQFRFIISLLQTPTFTQISSNNILQNLVSKVGNTIPLCTLLYEIFIIYWTHFILYQMNCFFGEV